MCSGRRGRGRQGPYPDRLGGRARGDGLKAIARSELVIIPAQASEPDLREALVVVSDIRDVAEEKGTPIAYPVLTRCYPLRTRVTDFVYQELERHGLRSRSTGCPAHRA